MHFVNLLIIPQGWTNLHGIKSEMKQSSTYNNIIYEDIYTKLKIISWHF